MLLLSFKKITSKPRARIEELLALLGKSSSSRRCCCSEEEEEEEEEKGVLFNPFLSKALAFLAREAETRKHHKNHAHLFLTWFLKIQNETKTLHSRRRETPPPRRRRRSAAALLLVVLLLFFVVVHRRRDRKRRESSERERKWTKSSTRNNRFYSPSSIVFGLIARAESYEFEQQRRPVRGRRRE